jgi:paraquat-inducible protein A
MAAFMVFELQGRAEQNKIVTGIFHLWGEGYAPLAVLIGFTSIAAPLIHLTGMFAVLAPIHLGRKPAYLASLFRFLEKLRPWSMLEVYLLGVLVAIIKLGQLASIELDIAFYAFCVLILVSIASYQALDSRQVWEFIQESGDNKGEEGEEVVDCEICHLNSSTTIAGALRTNCPRCGETLHHRKPDSLNRTTALVVCAGMLYIPANYFPVLEIEILGKTEADTILSGVVALVQAGMWEIGALVFFASIAVPLVKLVGLSCLILSVRFGSQKGPRHRTILYRVVEYIGRWSMIDMFMTSILVALVQLGAIATIIPGVGATCFASVVVITMFAAHSFDPRLIWDQIKEEENE